MSNCIILKSLSTLSSESTLKLEHICAKYDIKLLIQNNPHQQACFALLHSEKIAELSKTTDLQEHFSQFQIIKAVDTKLVQTYRLWVYSDQLEALFEALFKLEQLETVIINLKLKLLSSKSEPLLAIEVGISNSVEQTQLQNALREMQQQKAFDFILIHEKQHSNARRLICFDMDSTLIKTEVIDELAAYAGVGDQVSAITEQAMQGKLDFKQSFAQRMTLLNGLSADVLSEIAIQLPIMDGLVETMQAIKDQGHVSAILSGGFDYFAQHLQQRFGFDYFYTNQLEFVDNKLTGNVIEPIIDGEQKAQLLKKIALQENINIANTIAVGDGANDLAMIQTAGMGIAFRAKPIVREQAPHSINHYGLNCLIALV